MPGSLTTPGRQSTRVSVLDHIAFRYLYSVSTQDIPIAAQWLAYALPCRRFTVGLAATDARLGADAVRYSFIVSDFHRPTLCQSPGAQRFELLTPKFVVWCSSYDRSFPTICLDHSAINVPELGN